MAEALVHALFESDTRGLDEMLEVIYSYSHFVTAEALLEALTSHFRGISSSQSKPQGETIMLRIINFLKNWIKVEQKLFLTNPALDGLMKNFLLAVPPKWVPVLEMALNDKAEKQAEESDGDLTEQKPTVLTRKPSKAAFSVITLTILNYDAEEVARQLVLIDLQYCQKVNPKEFLNASWTKPDSTATPLGLNECAVRANAVAYWVAQQVLTCPAPKSRVKLLTHILLICQSLLKYQNFQSLMSFYLGLNLGPVEDLDLFSNLPKNVAEIWRDIKFLFDVASNFRNYRQKIKSINLPYILCQEILLKDLLFLEESQPDFVDDIFGRFVNQEKMYTIGKTIHSFVKSQRCSYGLSDYPELQEFLRTSPDMSELLNSLTSIELNVNFCENRTKEPSLKLTKPPEPTFGPNSPNSSQMSSYSGEDSSLHIEEMKNLSPTNSTRLLSPRRPRSIKSLFSDGPTSPRTPRHDPPSHHSLERSFTSPAKPRSSAPISPPKLSLTNTNSMSERESGEEEERKSKSGVVTRIRSRSLSSRSKVKNSTSAREVPTAIRSSPAMSHTVSSEKSPFGPLPQSRPLSTSLKERRERDKESASESQKERASNSPEADKRRERSKKKLTSDDSERSEKERFEPKRTNSSSKSLPKKKSPDPSLALLGVMKKSDGKIEKPDDGK